MLGIGEFSGLTGVSVKALRHYDEKGVLVPAEIDARSGYRRYAEAQVRAGVQIRTLRDAGLPLPEVTAAVASGDAAAALEEHRLRVLAQRRREDDAFRAAEVALRAIAAPVAVTERVMPAQPFLGQAISVPVEEHEALTDDDANRVLGELFERVQDAGLGPVGNFWTALRPGENGRVEIVCCWPTLSVAPESVHGSEAFSAVLPARTELVASWRPTSDEELREGVLHPAVVALFDAVGERRMRLDEVEVRQSVIATSETDYTVEVAVTIG